MPTMEAVDTAVAEFLDERREERRRAGGPIALTTAQKEALLALSQETGINSFPPGGLEYIKYAIDVVSARQRGIEHERRQAAGNLNQYAAFPIATTRV